MRPGCGGGNSCARCAADGCLTFDGRPSLIMRSYASCHDGSLRDSCVQCTRAASSHQSSNFGIASRCAPCVRNASIALSASHAVIVQKAFLASRISRPPTNPAERCACRDDRIAYHMNCGKKKIDRIRKRVTDTNTIAQMPQSVYITGLPAGRNRSGAHGTLGESYFFGRRWRTTVVCSPGATHKPCRHSETRSS